MKHLLLSCTFMAAAHFANAQVTISASDMPASGDTLRNSLALPSLNSLNLSNIGANVSWDYSTLTPVSQRVDAYKTALQVNPTYAFTISPTAYGYKVADSLGAGNLPLPVPIQVTDIYTFFNKKSNPSRFIAEAFAANVSGLPTPANYSDEDEIYFLPLQYGNSDSSSFKLNVSILGLGGLKQEGYRKTKVDGAGTIKTPFFTTPVNCIRVRSELNEVDSITFSGTSFGFPRKTVEYKWLTPGEHFPALWVTTDETTGTPVVTSVRYRDIYRQLQTSVGEIQARVQMLTSYPNPAKDNITIDVPKDWHRYQIIVFDAAGKIVAQTENQMTISTASFPAGAYVARVVSSDQTGYIHFVKE